MTSTQIKRALLDHITEILLLTIIAILWIWQPNFMTVSNWLNILKSSALKGVIAFGMTMVIIAGQIDLSIGSTVALSGVIVGFTCKTMSAAGVSLTIACILGIILAFVVSVVIGVFHGYSQQKFGMPAFIVTLATQLLLYGLAGFISGGVPMANAFPEWFYWIGTGKIGIIPVPAVAMLLVFFLSVFLMDYTYIGRSIYAAGGNEEAARLNGINVMRTKIICFVATSVLATLGGLMNSAQVMSATFSFGRGWETDVISAVVIGGTSMTGGIGKVWGTMVGILFLGVLINGMTILNVSVYMQYVVRAVLLFSAVLLSLFLPKLRQKL
jgi:ribose/xylose/arabinose/galactoside ABC-type transport system permease subunit